MSKDNPVTFKTVCWMCGVEHTQDKNNQVDTTQHTDWCRKITRKIYDDFQATFREVYNVLELSLDGKKLEIAKSLVGNKIMEARNKAIERVINYHLKDASVQIDKKFEPMVN